MTFSDLLQSLGDAFIIVGYWTMAKSVKWASVTLAVGALIYTGWSLYLRPVALPLTALELTCAGMSIRTFWISRRS